MAPLPYADLPALDRAVDAFLQKQEPSLKTPLFKLYKSTNRHALCYYADGLKIRLMWVLVRVAEDGSYVLSLEDVSLVHGLLLGADLENQDSGLVLKLRVPLNLETDLHLVQDELGLPMVVSSYANGTALIQTLYVDLADRANVQVHVHGMDMESGKAVHETKVVDLSGLPFD